jgi:hypothetical protein
MADAGMEPVFDGKRRQPTDRRDDDDAGRGGRADRERPC